MATPPVSEQCAHVTAATLWLIAQLSPDTQDKVRRRLALKLDPPLSPSDRRCRELRFVATLLRGIPRQAGWSFPCVPRNRYDARRPPDAPHSAALVATYGSWVNVCRHASRIGDAQKPLLPRPSRLRQARRTYCMSDSVAALQACTQALLRPPPVARTALGEKLRPTAPHVT
jgi:hypothetical protein